MKASAKVLFAFFSVLLWGAIAWNNLNHTRRKQHIVARRESSFFNGRQEHSRFKPSNFLDDGYVSDTCQDTLVGNMLNRFTAIVFNDYTTSEAQGVIGPLAIKGKFTGGSFTINQGHTSGCQNETNLDGYGLVVGTTFAGTNTHVFGAAYLPAGTDTKQLEEQTSGCPIYTDRGTGLFDFNVVEQNFLYASKQFSTEPPSLQLDANGKLTRIGQADSRGFDTVTFNTCSTAQTCTIFSGQLSDPNAMLYGVGNWNGPQGMTWPHKTIFNIPVLAGSTITLAGNQLSLQVDPCNSIMNFYPSDKDENYADEGTFTIRRETGGRVGGVILAPKADVLDSSMGSFAGQLISTNYGWESNGVFINDYAAAGGSCLNLAGCFPLVNVIAADPKGSTSSTSSQSSTATSSSSSTSSSSEESSNSSSSSSISSSTESSSSEESSSSTSSDESSSTTESSSDTSSSLPSNDESSSDESSSKKPSGMSSSSTEASSISITSATTTTATSSISSSTSSSFSIASSIIYSDSNSYSLDLALINPGQSSSNTEPTSANDPSASSPISSTQASSSSSGFPVSTSSIHSISSIWTISSSISGSIYSKFFTVPSATSTISSTETASPTYTARHFVGHRFYRHFDHYHDDTVYVCDLRDALPEKQGMSDQDWLDFCYNTFMNDAHPDVYVDIHPGLANDPNFIYRFDFRAYEREQLV